MLYLALVLLVSLHIIFAGQSPNLVFFPLSSSLHQGCLYYVQSFSKLEVNRVVICGQSAAGELAPLFKSLGLVHLLVISGAHIAILESFLDRVLHPKHYPLKLALLFLYAFVCQLKAPILRALFGSCLRWVSYHLHLDLPKNHQVLCSALLCLLFFPEWFFQLSLILSCLATQLTYLQRHSLTKNALIYFGLLPVLFMFAPLSPLTIIYNCTIAPIIGFVLIPLSWISCFLPLLFSLNDFLWSFFLQTVSHFPSVELNSSSQELSVYFFWIYLFLVLFASGKQLES